MNPAMKRKTRLEYIPGQVIIRVREAAVRPAIAATGFRMATAEAKLLPKAVSEPIEYLRRNAGLKMLTPIFSMRRDALAHLRAPHSTMQRLSVLTSVADSESEELRGLSVATLDPKKLTTGLLRHLNASRAIEFIEQMPARWLVASKTGADPMLNLQWGHRVIDWFDAKRPDAGSVTVAVLDTGIDANHPELKGTIRSYDYTGSSSEDIIGHGTHVAGIVAARPNNGTGIAGVANCKLAIWKIFGDKKIDGDFYVDGERFLQALRAVAGSGARVVNLSIGGTASSKTEALLIRRLAARGISVVAAMGNEYQDGNPVEYPAAYDGVIAVGSIAENRRRSEFSNTGKHIALVAPGSNILSILPGRVSPERDETDYAAWSGTSMASPYVAGAAALLVAKYPNLGVNEIASRFRRSAASLPAMKRKAWTNEYGDGLLNLKRLLA